VRAVSQIAHPMPLRAPVAIPPIPVQSLLQSLCSTNTFNTCDIGHFIHLEVELVSIKVGLEFG
jgi:hypothetical protein